jgi:hypothetical protein
MRVLLDACVMYPTVLREILLGVAKLGAYSPVWSERIVEEWARAARKIGPMGEPQARGEIALLRANWPDAWVSPRAGDEARLWLPDPNDIHVLAAAIASSADAIVTFNAKDFPRSTLSEEGVKRLSPDELLMEAWMAEPEGVAQAVGKVHAQACEMAGEDLALRALLKRARVPRLGKALA